MYTKFILYCTLILGIFSGGCKKHRTHIAGKSFQDYLPLEINNIAIEVQIAVTNSEKAKGLIGRKKLPENTGMLFHFEFEAPRTFWMKNTPLYLDIAFFDAQGILKEVVTGYPYNKTPILSTHKNIKYTLEMEKGWFAKNNVKVGDGLNMELLKDALSRRLS